MFIEDDLGDYYFGKSSSIEVIEEDKDYFTGLYSPEGRRIYREPNKIGFIQY